LRQYPYALPCIVASTFSLLGVTLAYFLMEEVRRFHHRFLWYASLTELLKQTLPSKGKNSPKQSKEAKSYGSIPNAPIATPLSAWQLFAFPSLRSLIISSFALSFVSTAFDTVFVLFAYTPVEAGGLAFNVCVDFQIFPDIPLTQQHQFQASQIGYSLSISGCLSCVVQLFITPILLQRFSCAKMYHGCMSIWFFPFVALPFLNLILRNGRDEFGQISPHARAVVWSGIVLVMFVSRLTCLAFA
jgi:hypothetical protein